MENEVLEEKRRPADDLVEEVVEVHSSSRRTGRPAMRRMSIEKRFVRRGSSHILIDVLRDSLEEIKTASPEDEETISDPSSNLRKSDPSVPSSALLEKHRITIAAVSPRVNRRGAAGAPGEGGAKPAYYEPHLRCGVYSMQGRRKAMEDAHTVELGSGSYEPRSATSSTLSPRSSSSSTSSSSSSSSASSSTVQPDGLSVTDGLSDALNRRPSAPDNLCAFFGVYDGHGGQRAASFAASALHNHILSNGNFCGDLKQAIREGFQKTEQEFLEIAKKDNMGDGTTALIAFIKQGTLFLGNIGDSEAVLSRDGKAIALTTVHNPGKNPTEIERVKREGGKLYHDTRLAHPNLNPSFFNLGVSRSIGDLLFKHPEFTKGKPSGLSAEPDVVDIALEPSDQFLILACDGLWDVMSHQQAVDYVLASLKNNDDPQVVSKALVEEAYKRGSQDNITAVVCTLLQESNEEQQSEEEEEEVNQEEVRVMREELIEEIPM